MRFERIRELGGLHGVIVMSIYRYGNFIHYHVKVPIIRHMLIFVHRILDHGFVRPFMNAEFPAQCKIGKRPILPHGGRGIVLHASVSIGDSVVMYHQVTVGVRNGYGSTIIGNRAVLGVGSKVLGTITVGNYAKIGANAVVLTDIPDYATAVGIPARVVKISDPH